MSGNETGSNSISHPTGRHREQPAERVEKHTWGSVRGADVDHCRPHPTETCYHLEGVTDEL